VNRTQWRRAYRLARFVQPSRYSAVKGDIRWHGQRFPTQNDTQPTNRCTILTHRPPPASRFSTLTARSLGPLAHLRPGGSGGLARAAPCRTTYRLAPSPVATARTEISRSLKGRFNPAAGVYNPRHIPRFHRRSVGSFSGDGTPAIAVVSFLKILMRRPNVERIAREPARARARAQCEHREKYLFCQLLGRAFGGEGAI
jgi:hypothetical protein